MTRILLVAAALAGSIAAAGPASAAQGCSGAGPTVVDHHGTSWSTTYCNAWLGGNLERGVGRDNPGEISGYLYANRAWFVCQQQFTYLENPPVGDYRNNWWLYTQGDEAYLDQGWGWFPAVNVSGGGNYEPIPGLRHCGFPETLSAETGPSGQVDAPGH
ncbi:hypothetical protein ACIRPH_08840 [Nocardiopsis sp. NPDC101807]|uniref:hypothetical protein n=1 Tax=Nocardiopsis sp. NPDC101807 TaxID=3364339 RepID=UPI00380BBCFE